MKIKNFREVLANRRDVRKGSRNLGGGEEGFAIRMGFYTSKIYCKNNEKRRMFKQLI